MKNLENYGVQEMDFKEIKETDGGGFLAKWAGYFLNGYGNALNNHYALGGSFCDFKNG